MCGVPGGLVVKNPSANVGDGGDEGSIPGLGRSSGRGNGNPLHYSCLGNPMVREAWWATCDPWDHKESDTTERLSKEIIKNFPFLTLKHIHMIL